MGDATTGPQGQPLCCKYFLVLFETLSVKVQEEGGAASDRTLRWSFGVLPSGEHEMLGAWVQRSSGVLPWQEVWRNMKVRGVEKIRFVSSSEAAELRAVLNTAYPGATVMPEVRSLETLSALPPRYRRFFRESADAMQLLQFCASRAVARHGRFRDPVAATALVIDALKRARHSIEVARLRGDAALKRPLAADARTDKSRTGDLGR